jgi:hypothetical protein
VDGSQNQILQGLDIVGVHRLGVDLDGLELAQPGHHDGHQAAAGGAGHLGLGQLGLGLRDLLLHLLRLLHDLLHVRLSTGAHGTAPQAQKGSFDRDCVTVSVVGPHPHIAGPAAGPATSR